MDLSGFDGFFPVTGKFDCHELVASGDLELETG
jgi:hypothetical protein